MGNNIDAKMWIADLKENEAEHIVVIDYESNEELKEIDGIIYMEPTYARTYIKKFDTKIYCKSMDAFPGMLGNMSFLYRENKN